MLKKNSSQPQKPICVVNSTYIELPDYLCGHKELIGVSIGCCIMTGVWKDRGSKIKDNNGNYIKKNGKFLRGPPAAAHAHIKGKGKGFICFATWENFKKKTTCLHELAHLICQDRSNSGHNREWAEIYASFDVPKWLTVEWLQHKYKFE